MSTDTLNTSPSAQFNERDLLVEIRNIDIQFRQQVRARVEELTGKAGADALEFLLFPEKMELKESALASKNHGDALEEGLGRYISACRHYSDVTGVFNTVRGVAESIETLRDFQKAEAQSHALKDLTGTPSEVADGRQRKMALNSNHRAAGSDEFVQMLKSAYASVQQKAVTLLENPQAAKARAIADSIEGSFDYDASAQGYAFAIRNALAQPDNVSNVRQALIDLATHLRGKDYAAELVGELDILVDELS